MLPAKGGRKMTKAERKRFVAGALRKLCREGRMNESRAFCQHGNTAVYWHSIRVAYYSLCLAEFLHLTRHKEELIYGALLHDYFLYDWHEKDKSHRLHGFHHPRTALKNASEDFTLSELEKNIILRHMFPLIPVPPTRMESWIVCLVDKGCSIYEIIRL